MYAIIRLRGSVKINRDIKYALGLVRLNRKNHCILLNENENNIGMINKIKDYITWGQIDDETLNRLIIKRGRKIGNEILTEEESGRIADELKSGKNLKTLGMKPVFRLTPPSGGFKKSI